MDFFTNHYNNPLGDFQSVLLIFFIMYYYIYFIL